MFKYWLFIVCKNYLELLKALFFILTLLKLSCFASTIALMSRLIFNNSILEKSRTYLAILYRSYIYTHVYLSDFY